MAGMTTWNSSAGSLLLTRASNNDSRHCAQLKSAKKSDNGNARTSRPSGSVATNSKICCLRRQALCSYKLYHRFTHYTLHP